ncbi:MAG: hypothetical protein A3I11_01760 [Elusimicrobia bacterium RIFCSPLOWO2_02_FULL_39_32]|nr:MAG: hypothetical protein A2034_04465 [Elusimicrobia bacterium GWA2_38_7]OGR78262.1 MAG: hypothetical protein A3B80_06245 [Elusimicrobia bacterium RIFCSPHIGHO2_02_FULL_39_36]OGR92400.1 MAG: hypothetical protein A3I11_01760 [Elusimicrobia bacterium RIFCSPLOWO2_02_FULL_39_32]OGR98943.1 MAG: hypothetical protein A3G85_04065 [Elusimicrobia bacterium RIFCSPLOWO2_12_FULL_39_28]
MKKISLLSTLLFLTVLSPALADIPQNEINKKFELGLELKRAEKFAEAAKIFSSIVEQDPKNTDALQQLATLQSWLGLYDKAISTWKQAITLHPNNIEYHVGLARVLSWKGEIKEAKTEYMKAFIIKQDDLDTLIGLGDLETRQGNISEAKKWYLKALTLHPDDLNLKKKLASAQPNPLWRIDAGFSYDGYKNSNSRTAEKNSFTQIGRGLSPKGLKSSLWLRHEWQHHFQFTDNTIYAGASLWPIKPLAIQFETGFTATPNFQPTQQFNTMLDFPIHKFVTPTIGIKYLAYRDGNVNLYTPGVHVQPIPWLGFLYRHSISKNITGPNTEGWQAQLDLQIEEKGSSYLGYSQGNEALPPLSTAFNEIIFAGVIFQLSKDWAVRIDYSYENRPNFFIRSSIGTGLTFKF